MENKIIDEAIEDTGDYSTEMTEMYLPLVNADIKLLASQMQPDNKFLIDDYDFSRDSFYKELCSIMQYESKERAGKIIRNLKSRVDLLPRTLNDVTSYLRKEQIKLLDTIEQNREVDNILCSEGFYFHKEKDLSEWVLNKFGHNDATWQKWAIEKLDLKPDCFELDDFFYLLDEFFLDSGQFLDKAFESLSYLLVIRWVRRQIWICEHVGISNNYKIQDKLKQSEITQGQLALYYVYLHITESLPSFELHPKGKIVAYQEVTKPHGFSWKGFQIRYNRYLSSPTQRRHESNSSVIKKVVSMLELHENAQKYALDELKIALGRAS